MCSNIWRSIRELLLYNHTIEPIIWTLCSGEYVPKLKMHMQYAYMYKYMHSLCLLAYNCDFPTIWFTSPLILLYAAFRYTDTHFQKQIILKLLYICWTLIRMQIGYLWIRVRTCIHNNTLSYFWKTIKLICKWLLICWWIIFFSLL